MEAEKNTTQREGLVTCRAGLEQVVCNELKSLGISVTRTGRRAVFFTTDMAGIYRANMGLRCALSVLLPIRTFNARNYDMLYFQSRKTNWHKMFPVDRTVRIDVNGGSDILTHSAYVVHRVKDGMVDTFRKLSEGNKRPSIDKGNPDIHVVVHLDGTKVTLCLDTSGLPLFKRGYRSEHGTAPIKEDLAAGILHLSGWDGKSPVADPMCGSGTFLFEAWMIAAGIAPNLNRSFAFESLFDYQAAVHAQEKKRLQEQQRIPADFKLLGADNDPSVIALLKKMASAYFPEAPVTVHQGDFQNWQQILDDCFVVSNPPYGVRLGEGDDMKKLYQDLGTFLRTRTKRSAAVFTAYEGAKDAIGIKTAKLLTLFNGALEGRLLCYKS